MRGLGHLEFTEDRFVKWPRRPVWRPSPNQARPLQSHVYLRTAASSLEPLSRMPVGLNLNLYTGHPI